MTVGSDIPPEHEVHAIQKGDTTSIAVIDGETAHGYPYFTIRRWVLSDLELCLYLDSGVARIRGSGLMKLMPSLQTQTLMVLRILSLSQAEELAGEPLVIGHEFDEYK